MSARSWRALQAHLRCGCYLRCERKPPGGFCTFRFVFLNSFKGCVEGGGQGRSWEMS